MAYNPNELFVSADTLGSGLRFYPSVVQPKTFAAGSGTLAKGTPVTFNTSTNQWVAFDADGLNGTDSVRGFVWPDDVELDSDEEVLGQVMLTGRVHFDDIPIIASYTKSDLQAELRANARDLGIIVEGLDQVR